MSYTHFPAKQGLYDPRYEKDACGVGFVCDIKGKRSNKIVKNGLTILERLAHRGAVGSDPKTGDGAGILLQMPHEFFKKVCSFELPQAGQYGTGLVFLPQDTHEKAYCKKQFSTIAEKNGLHIIEWRMVPLNSRSIGKTARLSEPVIVQPFISRPVELKDDLAFERRLYVMRKQLENAIRSSDLKEKTFFYITNLSCRTFSYKGLLMTDQLEDFFLDLKSPDMKSALALVHSRYSTNTFPTWDLAQPFRYLAHNGEINTLRGNINWMRAREGLLESTLFGDDIDLIKPIISPDMSDSASLDNAIEFLMLSGRSLPHCLMMLIPPAWEQDTALNKKERDFYRYHACFMEPWDGPAAVAVTDGTTIGAVLDRNGLRPARYVVTKNGLLVLASEVGVLDIHPADIAVSGRLEPGKILCVDTDRGEIITDETVKKETVSKRPYSSWVQKNLIEFEDLPATEPHTKLSGTVTELLQSFDYSREDIREIIRPMASHGVEPTGSMGNDTPHAVLSPKSELLFNYFKQLFAQVTNPAIDPIREEIVMSLESFVGPQHNIVAETPEHCQTIHIKEPILFDHDLERFKQIDRNGLKTKTISLLFDVSDTVAFRTRLDQICQEAIDAIQAGYTYIILSDRGTDKNTAALPVLLATGTIHHHLVKNALRTNLGILIESAEVREVHHCAVLFGYGADCINPYLAYEVITDLVKKKDIELPVHEALYNYRKALNKGILKILSKIGISTLRSYRGAQIFEALGLHQEVIEKAFIGTPSRIGGITLDIIARETCERHSTAYAERTQGPSLLRSGGIYQWKRDGAFHLWNPATIATIQDATRKNDYGRYKEFAEMINDQSQNPTTLRSLLRFKKTQSIPIDRVEPVESILARFATGAMSFGSISTGAHESLAIAMNRIGGRSNTGEGGEDPVRFQPLPNGDSSRSAIKQVASGRFGVSANYLTNADEIQIKIAQGAKPGEGGQLPGHKVSEIIARTRYTTPGVTLISPPPHHDIYSIEDLAQLIFDLKNINPRARISVKLVSEIGVGTIAAGVAKGHADMILISGADGGTGASPKSSIRHAGLPWELGLSETHQTLVLNDLRSRVRLQTDGQMRTGRDVAIATLLGAEEYGFCTVGLIIMGCVMLRHCHLNNCSVGVATQDELLQKRFRGNPDHIVNYMHFVAQELREIMASLGLRSIDDMVGRTELLEMNRSILPWKAHDLDYSAILYKPTVAEHIGVYKSIEQDHGIEDILDRDLIKKAAEAIHNHTAITIEETIENYNRTTGATLSGEICRHNGEAGLPEDTLGCRFTGVAGQSFGAFLAKGVTFTLIGLANDYVGKGLSGGKIIIYPDPRSTYDAAENIIIGNTTFYGASGGEAYIRGKAGERFCIRNSGVYAVVEGVGDHGCEYMTGGRVLILGPTGRNFAAGMSGGIAYIYDPDMTFKEKCNMSMVQIETPDNDDIQTIQILTHNHFRLTQSARAKVFIDDFSRAITCVRKVIPIEYKRIIDLQKVDKKMGIIEVSDG